MSRLIEVNLDDTGLPMPTKEIEQERRVAIFDLLEKNSFILTKADSWPGPYKLTLRISERKLVFDVCSDGEVKVVEFHLSLGPFKQVVKDYFKICASYFEAVKKLPPSQIETIDMARRGIHDEGARILVERLGGKVGIDIDTSRRLFTLICVLHFGG